MWKVAVGFAIFAAAGVWMLSKGGDIDIGGEKHEIPVAPAPEVAASSATASTKPASAP